MSMRTSCSVAAACSSTTEVELELLNVLLSDVSAELPNAPLSAEVPAVGAPAPAPAPAISTRVPAHEPRCVADEPRPCDAVPECRSAARCVAFRSSDGGTSMWKAGLPPAPSVTELNGPASASWRHVVQALPEPRRPDVRCPSEARREARLWSTCGAAPGCCRALMASR